MIVTDKIRNLFTGLMPTGLAFRGPVGGYLQALNRGLSYSENKAYTDAVGLLDTILPDNPNFDENSATDWERRLGLVNGTGVPLEDRKLAIRRKYNHPGTIKARQHPLYIQSQLQATGFNLYVYKNQFDDGMGGLETRNPADIAGFAALSQFQLNDHQLNDAQLAGGWGDVVANSIYPAADQDFNVGTSLRFTFFVGGPDISTPATAWGYVPANRRTELRQLLLKLKPVESVAYLLIVYT